MRHQRAGRKLNRDPEHRLSLRRNLTRALIEHGRITTTLPKAKDLRPFVEKLITMAKKAAISEDVGRKLHLRRQALAKLPDKATIKVLFEEIGPRYVDRPGGYTRIIKRDFRRLGDGGETAFIELLAEGEQKFKARKTRQPEPVAPAPVVAPTEETPAPPVEEKTPPETNVEQSDVSETTTPENDSEEKASAGESSPETPPTGEPGESGESEEKKES